MATAAHKETSTASKDKKRKAALIDEAHDITPEAAKAKRSRIRKHHLQDGDQDSLPDETNRLDETLKKTRTSKRNRARDTGAPGDPEDRAHNDDSVIGKDKRPNNKKKGRGDDGNHGENAEDHNGRLSEKTSSTRQKEKDAGGADDSGPAVAEKQEGSEKPDGKELSKKKKRKPMKPEGDEATKGQCVATEGQPDTEKPKKRSKKRKPETGQSEVSVDTPKTEEIKMRKKKHKKPIAGSDDLPVPADDAALSDKARNALQYAYTRLVSPSKWKFNKASQNWIVKNVWLEEAVPEKYTTIVAGYLADSQGSVRANLTEKCQAILTPSEDNAVAAQEPDFTKSPANQVKARTILDALGAPNSSGVVTDT